MLNQVKTKLKRNFILLTVSLLFLSIPQAKAQLIQASFTCTGDFQEICTDITNEMQSQIDRADIPDLNISSFANGSAEATALIDRGSGTDYVNKMELFTVKANALGFGLTVPSGGFSEDNLGGIAFAQNLAIGVNMGVLNIEKVGPVELKKLDVFVNFFGIDANNLIDTDEFSAGGESSTFGLMGRYQIYEPKEFLPFSMFSWEGLYVHTGIVKSSNKIAGSATLDNITETPEFDVDVGGGVSVPVPINLSLLNPTGRFSTESEALVIPIEVSTGIRFLYLFSLYGGLGLDLVSASNKTSFAASGDLNGTPDTSDVTLPPGESIDGDIEGEIVAGQSANGSAASTNMRAFIGIQANIWILKPYITAQKSFSNDAMAVNLGASIVW